METIFTDQINHNQFEPIEPIDFSSFDSFEYLAEPSGIKNNFYSGSLTVRYSFFNFSWRWWQMKIMAFARTFWNASLPSIIVFAIFMASRWISTSNNSFPKYQ